MNKNLWRNNFEIAKPHLVIFSHVVDELQTHLKLAVPGFKFKECLFVFEGGANIGSYFRVGELRDLVEKTLSQIFDNPKRVAKVHQKVIACNEQLYNDLKGWEKIEIKKLSDKKLSELFYKIVNQIMDAHGFAVATTWFVDSDGEDLSKRLLGLIAEKLKNRNIGVTAHEAFSLLTTPGRQSLSQQEEIEFYKVLSLIVNDKKAKNLLSKDDVEAIEAGLGKMDRKIVKSVESHYKKWRWMPYTYIGPAYDLNYYLSLWSSLVRQRTEPEKEILKLKQSFADSKRKRAELVRKLRLSKREKEIFDISAEIVWIKGYRKEVSFYAYYVLGNIMNELAKRNNLSTNQINQVVYREIRTLNKIKSEELNKRQKACIIYLKNDKMIIETGERAKKYLSKQRFEKIEEDESDVLTGTPAYVGHVKGSVKIINQPEEMGKMNSGDIMVAHTTFPSLITAMKLASAIITDDGGITCHAAIVARELKKPCIVGTKKATKVLKDGDFVDVDAEKGEVKIIE